MKSKCLNELFRGCVYFSNRSINIMATASVRNLQNPFLKTNPFYRPQKFYSQDKLPRVAIEPEFPSKSAAYTSNPSRSIKAELYQHVGQHSYSSSKYSTDEQISLSRFSHAQKDRTLAKRCINLKENPFLRKNLMPLIVEDHFQEENPFHAHKKHQQSRQYFSNSAKNSYHRQNDQLVVSVVTPPHDTPKLHNKQNQEIAMSSRRQSIPTFNQSSRRLQVPEESKVKYLSSELRIKLKSQTLIQASEAEPSSKNVVENGEMIPATLQMRGKTFFLREVQYRI